MNRHPSRARRLLLLIAAAAAAAALSGCAGAATQPDTPASEARGARSIDISVVEGGRGDKGERRAGSVGQEVSCYEAFQPGLEPALDLARLAAACAAPAGLTAVTPVHIGEPQTEDAPAERLTFLGRAGRCYRVFSIGAPSVTDLDVALFDADGRIAAVDASSDRFPIVPTRGALCLRKDELFTIHAAVMQGSGSYLMQVWGN